MLLPSPVILINLATSTVYEQVPFVCEPVDVQRKKTLAFLTMVLSGSPELRFVCFASMNRERQSDGRFEDRTDLHWYGLSAGRTNFGGGGWNRRGGRYDMGDVFGSGDGYLVWISFDKTLHLELSRDEDGAETLVPNVGSSYVMISVRHHCLQSRPRGGKSILAALHSSAHEWLASLLVPVSFVTH